jgi:hypothetical protein
MAAIISGIDIRNAGERWFPVIRIGKPLGEWNDDVLVK